MKETGKNDKIITSIFFKH